MQMEKEVEPQPQPEEEVKQPEEEIKQEEEIPKVEEQEEQPKKEEKKKKPKYFIRGFKPNTPISISKATKIGKLDVPAVMLWRNFYFSLAVFLVGQASFMLISKFRYPIVTLIGRIVMIQMIIGLIYKVATKILDGKTIPAIPFDHFKIPEDLVALYAEAIAKELNVVIAKLIELMTFKNVKNSVIFFVVVQIISWLGKKYTLLGMIHFVFTVALIVPKVYEWKYDLINLYAAKGMEIGTKKGLELYEKIPKSQRAQVEGFMMKAQKYIKEKSE